MIFHDQTTFSVDGDHGDCQRACVASLIDVDPKILEHPVMPNGDVSAAFYRQLRGMGLAIRSVTYDERMAPDCVIRDVNWGNFVVPNIVMACGPTERSTTTLHAVLWDRAAETMLHDPHPSRAGLTEIRTFDYIAPYPGPSASLAPIKNEGEWIS